jgi:hypothetical protein
MCYDRINIKTKEITRDPFDIPENQRTPDLNERYEATWVKNEELFEYDKAFREPKE